MGSSRKTGSAQGSSSERREPAPDAWISLRRTLKSWDQQQLLGLIHELYKTVPDARAAIAGRLLLDQPSSAKRATLDELRKRARQAVWPSGRGLVINPDMRAARRIGDQYLRSTSDADGAIMLYVEVIEAAMELSCAFGLDDDGFYDSIWRTAQAAEKQLPSAGDGVLLEALARRVEALLDHPNFPGWDMDEVVRSLAAALGARARHTARQRCD